MKQYRDELLHRRERIPGRDDAHVERAVVDQRVRRHLGHVPVPPRVADDHLQRLARPANDLLAVGARRSHLHGERVLRWQFLHRRQRDRHLADLLLERRTGATHDRRVHSQPRHQEEMLPLRGVGLLPLLPRARALLIGMRIHLHMSQVHPACLAVDQQQRRLHRIFRYAEFMGPDVGGTAGNEAGDTLAIARRHDAIHHLVERAVAAVPDHEVVARRRRFRREREGMPAVLLDGNLGFPARRRKQGEHVGELLDILAQPRIYYEIGRLAFHVSRTPRCGTPRAVSSANIARCKIQRHPNPTTSEAATSLG